MAAADASAVGLAVQITQLHHNSVSNDKIQGSLQNLCRAQGIDKPTTQARVQEAFHIWSTISTALQRTSLSNVPTPQGNEDPAPAAANTTVNPNEQPPAWLATLLAAIQPTNTVNTAAKRRRQPDPDMFDSTRKQYQVFYQQLTAKVENNKNNFENNKMACDYAFARLKGTAATLTLPYMNQIRISGKWDFNQLLGFFDQMFGDPHKEERARDRLWSMSQGSKNIRSYVMEFQEQLLLSNSSLDENTKMMIFKKGLAYKLQDKLVGLKSKNLEEIQNRAIEIADQLYRMDLHTKGTKNRRREDRSPNKEHRSRHRSTSPVLEDRMEGVEYTGRSGKPRRLSSSEYDRLRREGRCFNCKRRGHVSATCAEDKDMSEKKGKNKKTAVLKVSSSKTTERRKSRKAQKEELNSDEESSGVDTPEEDSDSGKD
ncbi:hypothetical protein P3342_009117 [Pyrenophora teres f. teres]|nr:hypothetical protein P3342_009117 [Pyrenophora teres f. teres]